MWSGWRAGSATKWTTASWSATIRFPDRVVTSDGCSLALASRDGRGTPVLAVHATGFCKELWEPVVEGLLSPRPVVAPDQRGHGDSSVPEPPYDWWDLGRDVLAVVDSAGLEGSLGLGHSSGATALVMAEVLRTGTFGALVLVEPIIFPGIRARMEENPMSVAALRRRRAFPSPEAALDSLRLRGPFVGWTDRALALYAAQGFRSGEAGWTLKCLPEIEAEFYRGATAHGVWERLGEVACPVVLVAGERSASHAAPFIGTMVRQFAEARLVVVPGATHFLPMEQPETLSALVASFPAGG